MQPDWYPAWRDEAIEQLKAKNARSNKEFRLGDCSRYDYDLTAGTLLFSQDRVAKVVTEIQIVGSTSTEAGNWLWAWANSSLPSELLSDAKLVRSFGEQNGIDELAQAYATDADSGWLGTQCGDGPYLQWVGYLSLSQQRGRRWLLSDAQEHQLGKLTATVLVRPIDQKPAPLPARAPLNVSQLLKRALISKANGTPCEGRSSAGTCCPKHGSCDSGRSTTGRGRCLRRRGCSRC